MNVVFYLNVMLLGVRVIEINVEYVVPEIHKVVKLAQHK